MDALALIQQLEATVSEKEKVVAELSGKIGQLEAERNQLLKKVEQLQLERDAAVAELANSDSPCDFCKYLKKFAHEIPCNNCVHVLHGEESQFKWRGVQKEE